VTRLLRVVPEPWRARFRAEITEALETSERPVRDRADLIRWGVQLRVEKAVRKLVLVGTLLVVVGALATAWASGELGGGIAEIPRHWWSTLATLPLLAGVALLLLSALRRQEV
jgi:hypothetical protein